MVIHRSAARVIRANESAMIKQNLDGVPRGWHSPLDSEYRPVGQFENIVPVIEELKTQLDNSGELKASTQKTILKMKKDPNHPLYKPAVDVPSRTLNSIQKGVADLRMTTSGGDSAEKK